MATRDPQDAGDGVRRAVPTSPILLADEPEDLLHCAHRHLAVAATQLANGGMLSPEETARYALAAARFRALTEQPWGNGGRWRDAAPFVTTVSGAPVSMADLFATACLRHRVVPPPRSIAPELVDEAKDLLRGLAWQVPALAVGD